MASILLLASCVLSVARAFSTSQFSATRLGVKVAAATGSLDMNDPAVVAEFNKIKDLDEASVKYELNDLGIPFPPAAGDMELRLVLMEARIRLSSPGVTDATKKKSKAPPKGERVARRPRPQPAPLQTCRNSSSSATRNRRSRKPGRLCSTKAMSTPQTRKSSTSAHPMDRIQVR